MIFHFYSLTEKSSPRWDKIKKFFNLKNVSSPILTKVRNLNLYQYISYSKSLHHINFCIIAVSFSTLCYDVKRMSILNMNIL